MTDVISQLASQYEIRGQVANLSDVIRDSMAHRSNMMFSTSAQKSTIKITPAERAASLYTDWESDIPSDWSASVKKRQGKPYAFHSKIGKWVPTHSRLEWLPDMNDWISANATTTATDREEHLTKWMALSRIIRVKTPYSYFPVEQMEEAAPASIIIRNIDPNVSDADLLMAFSVFGPIIDLHHPLHWKNKKRSFFVFIEYQDVSSVDKLLSEIDGILYFMGCPISIERAGARKTSEFMKNKISNV